MTTSLHDDIIKWKHFRRYWPFVRGIHRSPVNSPHKGQWRGALVFSLICALNKRLSKQAWGSWFEMAPHPLWRHSNGWYILVTCTTVVLRKMTTAAMYFSLMMTFQNNEVEMLSLKIYTGTGSANNSNQQTHPQPVLSRTGALNNMNLWKALIRVWKIT